MLTQRQLTIQTRGRGTYEITRAIAEVVSSSGVRAGICQVFVHHTSASLIITENADPDVQVDLDTYFGRLVPDGDRRYIHTAEGPDDMAAHVRSVLTATSLTVPLRGGRLDLGTWQGVFLWEHRHRGHRRRVTVTVIGAD